VLSAGLRVAAEGRDEHQMENINRNSMATIQGETDIPACSGCHPLLTHQSIRITSCNSVPTYLAPLGTVGLLGTGRYLRSITRTLLGAIPPKLGRPLRPGRGERTKMGTCTSRRRRPPP